MNTLTKKLLDRAPHIFDEMPVLFAYLYGSRVTGLEHPFSDLDVAVFVEGIDTRACLELELALSLQIDEALDHLVQTDVRTLNHLPLSVTGRILGEAELIYSRTEAKRIDFETRIRRAYFDFLPVIHRHQQAIKERHSSILDHQ